MRTFPKAVVFFGMTAILCLSRCGPVVSSLQKGTPGFGNLGPSGPSDGSSDQIARVASVESDSGAKSGVTKFSGGLSFADGSAQLQSFKEKGEIDITPHTGSVDLDSLAVKIRVSLSASRIDELKISQLPLKLVERDDHVFLVIAQQSTSEGGVIQLYATAVELQINGSGTAASKSGRRIHAKR
jgi:hypothetical protein